MDQDNDSETFKVAITGAFIIALKLFSMCNPCAWNRDFDCDMGERVDPQTPGAVGMVWPCNCCKFHKKGADCKPLGRTPNDFLYDLAQKQWGGKLYQSKPREGEPRSDNEVPPGWQGEDPGTTPPPLANELLQNACAVLQAPSVSAKNFRPIAKAKKRQAGHQNNAGPQQQQQQNYGFGAPASFAPPPPPPPQASFAPPFAPHQHWQQPPAPTVFVPGLGWVQPASSSAGASPAVGHGYGYGYGYPHMMPTTAPMMPPAGRGAGPFPASPSMGPNPMYGGPAFQAQGSPQSGGMYQFQAGRGRGNGFGGSQGQARPPQMARRQSDLEPPRRVPRRSNPLQDFPQTQPDVAETDLFAPQPTDKISTGTATTTPQASNPLKRTIDDESQSKRRAQMVAMLTDMSTIDRLRFDVVRVEPVYAEKILALAGEMPEAELRKLSADDVIEKFKRQAVSESLLGKVRRLHLRDVSRQHSNSTIMDAFGPSTVDELVDADNNPNSLDWLVRGLHEVRQPEQPPPPPSAPAATANDHNHSDSSDDSDSDSDSEVVEVVPDEEFDAIPVVSDKKARTG